MPEPPGADEQALNDAEMARSARARSSSADELRALAEAVLAERLDGALLAARLAGDYLQTERDPPTLVWEAVRRAAAVGRRVPPEVVAARLRAEADELEQAAG